MGSEEQSSTGFANISRFGQISLKSDNAFTYNSLPDIKTAIQSSSAGLEYIAAAQKGNLLPFCGNQQWITFPLFLPLPACVTINQ